MKILTKAEEEVMQVLWKLEKAFVKEMIQEFDEPRPAYNTVSTIVRILEEKGFIAHNSFGKSHQYYPIVNQKEYSKHYMQRFVNKYFDGSFKRFVSFFAKEEDLSLEELDEMIQILKDNKNAKS